MEMSVCLSYGTKFVYFFFVYVSYSYFIYIYLWFAKLVSYVVIPSARLSLLELGGHEGNQ